MRTYELIEHTADIGIRVRGKDLRELFANTAAAIFDIIAEKLTEPAKKETVEINQRADNPEELLINWLNELLSLSSAKELIFSKFLIKKIDKNEAQRAKACGFLERNTERQPSICALKSTVLWPRMYRLEATATGSPMSGYKVNVEVKAATYHQLKLRESESGWQAEVIFDV